MRSSHKSLVMSQSRLVSGILTFALCQLLQPCLAESQQPQPIVASTSSDFIGYDGAWSAISIRVGTPQQYLSVLPSTLSQETWVIGPAGCDGTSTCINKRGGLYSANESTTFQERGFFELTSEDDGFGYYGLDTIHLSDTISSPEQIIASVNSTDDWIGSLGLGVQQTRFNGTENLFPLLSSLVANGSYIPSNSYGYTAGAFYRLKSVPASLTFGGIDANRFVPNNMTFSLSTDYTPVVAINSISVSSSPSNEQFDTLPGNWNSNPTTLLDAAQAELFTIDSSTPFLWLPETVCDNFANALNLTYNETLGLYLYDNDTMPGVLTDWNLTFTFSISDLPGSSDNIELTLPYDAFNLQLSYPFPNLDANFTSPPTRYFPLRKAANSTQFIIGRSFLQETYLTVDYERNNFSLSQNVFTLDAVNNVNLQAISRPENSTFPGPVTATGSGSGLSTGTKAGIAICGVVIAVLASIAVWYFCFKRKRSSNEQAAEKTKRRTILSRLHIGPDSKTSVSELLGDKRHPTEVPADSSASRFELSGNVPVEMAAAEDVSPTFLQSGQRSAATSRNDPRNPAELEEQDTSSKAAEAAANAGGSQRSSSPVPPYSPAEVNNRYSNSVSPYTPRHSQGFGTVSSGEQGVSPVGGSSDDSSRRSGTSNPLVSPISPEATMARPLHDRYARQLNHSPSTTSTRSTLLVPQVNGRPLSRSPSTGSRFVEQGLGAVAEEQAVSPPPRTAARAPRFSWEQ